MLGIHRQRDDRTGAPHGVRYKKPKHVPGKADPEAQEAHLAECEKNKQNKGENDVICFKDAAHPQHNPVLGYGWIKRGEDHEVPSNTGRQRVNINGAIDLERLEPVVRLDETINTDSTIALFEQLEEFYAVVAYIYVICNNARYYRSRAVKEYLKTSRIKLVFLPPYAPNLNLIERLWKFFKKKSFTTVITTRLTHSAQGLRRILHAYPVASQSIHR